MGAGHVGSTVFDIALGSHPQIESLGEISKFHRFGWIDDKNRKCACGLSVYECSFWSHVRHLWVDKIGGNYTKRYLYLQKRIEDSRIGWVRLSMNSILRSSEIKEYNQMTEALYKSVHEVGGKPILVDSSLSPRRAYALTLNSNIDLYLIHFIRDGRGCIWSLKKPGKKILTKTYVPAPARRTAKYWISANLQSTLVYNRISEEKRLQIRYEDFATNPESILKQIGLWVGVDLSEVVLGSNVVNAGQVRHTVGGNRVRMLKEICIKPDTAWMENLPSKDRKTFWLMAGWLARKYGYIQHPV
jgi:hypothetical protein